MKKRVYYTSVHATSRLIGLTWTAWIDEVNADGDYVHVKRMRGWSRNEAAVLRRVDKILERMEAAA